MQIYLHVTVFQIKECVVFFRACCILGNGEYSLLSHWLFHCTVEFLEEYWADHAFLMINMPA